MQRKTSIKFLSNISNNDHLRKQSCNETSPSTSIEPRLPNAPFLEVITQLRHPPQHVISCLLRSFHIFQEIRQLLYGCPKLTRLYSFRGIRIRHLSRVDV